MTLHVCERRTLATPPIEQQESEGAGGKKSQDIRFRHPPCLSAGATTLREILRLGKPGHIARDDESASVETRVEDQGKWILRAEDRGLAVIRETLVESTTERKRGAPCIRANTQRVVKINSASKGPAISNCETTSAIVHHLLTIGADVYIVYGQTCAEGREATVTKCVLQASGISVRQEAYLEGVGEKSGRVEKGCKLKLKTPLAWTPSETVSASVTLTLPLRLRAAPKTIAGKLTSRRCT